MSLFSIIIPTYNRADALQRCLDSLTRQTFKEFEVIVSDDGSSDRTQEVVNSFRGSLDISYYFHKNWGGPARPRNVGLSYAKSEWICFLDSDDWYDDNRLDLLSNLISNRADFYYHPVQVVKGGKVIGISRSRKLPGNNAYYDLLFNLNPIATSSTCIRRSFFSEDFKFREDRNIIGVEDFDLWVRLASKGARFYYCKTPLSFYNLGDGNISFFDERQSHRFRSVYSFFIDMEANPRKKRKITAALNYQLSRVQKGWPLSRAYLRASFLHGSMKIRLQSLFFLISKNRRLGDYLRLIKLQ